MADTVIIPLSVQFKDAVQNFKSLVESYQKELDKLTPGTSIYKSIEAQLKQAMALVKRTDLQANIGVSKESQITKMTSDLEAVQHILGNVKEAFSNLGFKDLNLGHGSFEQFKNDVKTIENEINSLNAKKQELENMSVAGALNKAGLDKKGFNKGDLDKGVIQYYNEVTAAIQKAEQAIVKLQEQQKLLNTSITANQSTMDQTKDAHFLNNLYNSFGMSNLKMDKVSSTYSNMLTEQYNAGTLGSVHVQNALKMIGLDDATISMLQSSGADAAQKFQEVLANLNQTKMQKSVSKYLKENYGGAQGMKNEAKAYDNANKQLLTNNAKLGEIASKIKTQENAVKRYTVRRDKISGVTKEYSDLQNNLNTLSQRVTTLEQQVANSVGKGLGTGNVPPGDQQASAGIAKNEAQQQLGTAIDNMARRWVGTYAIVNKVRRAIRQAWNDIKNLDKAMTNIAVVTNMSVDQLWGQIDQYMSIAQQYGVTTQGVYEVSQIFYQQGLDASDVMAATTETLKMARIAGMDYKEAADAMTVAIRAFKMEMTDAAHVTDVYSKVASITASDSNELATAMSKTASSAENVGSSFENTTAMLAVMIETTRESAQNLGSALKSIISRYGEMKAGLTKDSEGEEIDFNKVDTALKSVGISIKDAQGQFRDFDDVIFELSEKWDTLDKNTQRYIATIMAGNRQQSRFIALVDNWERLDEISNVANNEADDAGLLQYSKTLDSLDAKINNLKTSFQELYMSIANGPAFKEILDFINRVLQGFAKFKNNLITFLPGLIVSIKSIFTLIKMLSSNMFSGMYANAVTAAQQVSTTTITIHKQTEDAKNQITGQAVQQRVVIETQGAQQSGQAQISGWRNSKGKLWGAGSKAAGFAGMGLSLIGSGVSIKGAEIAGQGGSANLVTGAWMNAAGGTLSGAGMGFMVGGPWGALAGAILGGLGGVIEAIKISGDKVLLAQEDYKQAQKEEEEVKLEMVEDTDKVSKLSNYIDELKKLSTQKNLSEEKQKEWIELNNEIYENFPELSASFDDLGNATINLMEAQQALEDATLEALESRRKHSAAALKTALAGEKVAYAKQASYTHDYFVESKNAYTNEPVGKTFYDTDVSKLNNYYMNELPEELIQLYKEIFTGAYNFEDPGIPEQRKAMLGSIFDVGRFYKDKSGKSGGYYFNYKSGVSANDRVSDWMTRNYSDYEEIILEEDTTTTKKGDTIIWEPVSESKNINKNNSEIVLGREQFDYLNIRNQYAEKEGVDPNSLYIGLNTGQSFLAEYLSYFTEKKGNNEYKIGDNFVEALKILMEDQNFLWEVTYGKYSNSSQLDNKNELFAYATEILREHNFQFDGAMKEYAAIQARSEREVRLAERTVLTALSQATNAQVAFDYYYAPEQFKDASGAMNIIADQLGRTYLKWIEAEENVGKSFEDFVTSDDYAQANKDAASQATGIFNEKSKNEIEQYNELIDNYQDYSYNDFFEKLEKFIGVETEGVNDHFYNYYRNIFYKSKDIIDEYFDKTYGFDDSIDNIIEKIPLLYYDKVVEFSEQLQRQVAQEKLSSDSANAIIEYYLNVWERINTDLEGDAKRQAQTVLANADLSTFSGIQKAHQEIQDIYNKSNKIFDIKEEDMIENILPSSLENLNTALVSLASSAASVIDKMAEKIKEGQKGFSSAQKAFDYAEEYDLNFEQIKFDDNSGTWKISSEGMKKVVEEEKKAVQKELNAFTTARKKQIDIITKTTMSDETPIDEYISNILIGKNEFQASSGYEELIGNNFYTTKYLKDTIQTLDEDKSFNDIEMAQFMADWDISINERDQLFEETLIQENDKTVSIWKKKTDLDFNTEQLSSVGKKSKKVIDSSYIELNNILSANWEAYIEYYYSTKKEERKTFSAWLEEQGKLEEEALKEQVEASQQYLDREATRNINIEENKKVFESFDLTKQREYEAYQSLINNHNKLTDEMLGTIVADLPEELGIDAENLKEEFLEYNKDTDLYSLKAGFKNSDIFKAFPVYVQNALLNIFQQQILSAKEALNNFATKMGSGETLTESDYGTILGDNRTEADEFRLIQYFKGELDNSIIGYNAFINKIMDTHGFETKEEAEKYLEQARGRYNDSIKNSRLELFKLYAKGIDEVLTQAESETKAGYEQALSDDWTSNINLSSLQNRLDNLRWYIGEGIQNITEEEIDAIQKEYIEIFDEYSKETLGYDFDLFKNIKEADGLYDKDNIAKLLAQYQITFSDQDFKKYFGIDKETGKLVLKDALGFYNYIGPEAARAYQEAFSISEAEKILNKAIEKSETQDSIQSTLEDFYGDLSSVTLSQLTELYKQVTGKEFVDGNTLKQYSDAINAAEEGQTGLLIQRLQDIIALAKAANYDIDTSALEAAYKDAQNTLIKSLITMLESAVSGTLSAADLNSLSDQLNLDLKNYTLQTVDGWQLNTEGLMKTAIALKDKYGDTLGVTEKLYESLVGDGKAYKGWHDLNEEAKRLKDKSEELASTDTERSEELEKQSNLLKEMAYYAQQMAEDARFDFMNQDVTNGMGDTWDTFVSNIDSAKTAINTLKQKGSIDLKEFQNLMAFVGKETEYDFKKIGISAEEAIAQITTAFANAKEGSGTAKFFEGLGFNAQNFKDALSKYGEGAELYKLYTKTIVAANAEIDSIDAEAIMNLGLSMEGVSFGFTSSVQKVAKSQIEYLQGIYEMLNVMEALEGIGSVNFGMNLDFTVNGQKFNLAEGIDAVLNWSDEDLDGGRDTLLSEIASKLQKSTGDGGLGNKLFGYLFGEEIDLNNEVERWFLENLNSLNISELTEGQASFLADEMTKATLGMREGSADYEAAIAKVYYDYFSKGIENIPEKANALLIAQGNSLLKGGKFAAPIGDASSFEFVFEGDTPKVKLLDKNGKEITGKLTSEQIEEITKIARKQIGDIDNLDLVVNANGTITYRDVNPEIKTKFGGEDAQFDGTNYIGEETIDLNGEEIDGGEVTVQYTAAADGSSVEFTRSDGTPIGDDADYQAAVQQIAQNKGLTEIEIEGKATGKYKIAPELEQTDQMTQLVQSVTAIQTMLDTGKVLQLAIDNTSIDAAADSLNAIVSAWETLQQFDKAGPLSLIVNRGTPNGQNSDGGEQDQQSGTTLDLHLNREEIVEELITLYTQITTNSIPGAQSPIIGAQLALEEGAVQDIQDTLLERTLTQPVELKYSGSPNLSTLTRTVKLDYEADSANIVVTVNDGAAGATGNVALAMGRLMTGAAFAQGTLMGELGPELYVQDGQYHIAGANGPEFVDLHSDAIVFNHLQTEGLMNRGHITSHGKPKISEHHAIGAYASGNAMASGISEAKDAVQDAISLWSSLLNASLGDMLGASGGGGGGGNSIKAVTQELQEWYNLLRKIEKLEKDINLLQTERNNLAKGDGAARLRSMRQEQQLLREQAATQAVLLDYQRLQLDRQKNEINTNSIWSQFLEVGENGLLQYKKGNETNGGKGALEVLQELNEMSGEDQIKFLGDLGYTYTTADGEELKDSKLVEQFYKELQEQIDQYDTLYDTVREAEVALENYTNKVNELEEEIRQNKLDLEQSIYDIIVEAWKKEIELLEEQSELIQEANNTYINGIREAVNTEKELYDQNQKIEDRESLQRQLSLLRRSGGSASEIANLEKQLDNMLKDEYFEHQNDMIENIQEANDKQIKLLEQQIKIQQESLEYQQEHGIIWEEVAHIMSLSRQEILDFMQGTDSGFFKKSAEQQYDTLMDWSEKVGIFTEDRKLDQYAAEGIANYFDNGNIWDDSSIANYQSTFNSMSKSAQGSIRTMFGEAYAQAINEGQDSTNARNAGIAAITPWLNGTYDAEQAEKYNEPTRPTGGDAKDWRYVVGGSLHLRDSASTSGKSLGTHPTGTKVKVLQDLGDWCKVEVNGQTGYMMSKYLEKRNESSSSAEIGASKYRAYYNVVDSAGKVLRSNAYGAGSSESQARNNAYYMGNKWMKENNKTGTVKITKVSAYSQGGLVDYTGLAMVHGSKKKPESFLNAEQTARITDALKAQQNMNPLKETLSRLQNAINLLGENIRSIIIPSANQANNINIASGAITISVQELNDSYDIDEVVNDIQGRILSIAAKSTNRSVNRR